jgi:hypothetical protein
MPRLECPASYLLLDGTARATERNTGRVDQSHDFPASSPDDLSDTGSQQQRGLPVAEDHLALGIGQ